LSLHSELGIGVAVAVYIIKTVFDFLSPILKRKAEQKDVTTPGLPAVVEPCSFAGEHGGTLAAKIAATHSIVSAEDEDGAKRVYTPRSIDRTLAKLVDIQAAQQRLLERMDTSISEIRAK